MVKFEEEKQERKLEALRHQEEEESTKIIAQRFNLPHIDLSVFPIELDALKTISEEHARAAGLAIFQIVGRTLKIAVRNPDAEATKISLAHLAEDHYTCELYITSQHSLEHAWSFYKIAPEVNEALTGIIQVSNERLETLSKEIKGLEEIKTRIEATFHGRTTEALEVVLAGAIALGASDIHIEPQQDKVRLRVRVDGMLYDVASLPTKLYTLLLSRIKLISEIKLNIRDRAQDGRFTIKTGNIEIEVRVSTLPGPNGENIVTRILNPKSIQIAFEDLGMQPWITETMARELKRPDGMILTTGPTGSGKTTTLYSALQKIHSPQIKIITIEDPIEYHLKGIEQTQVASEKGYDFANGLRAIVRQDPDVILVGEIRDLETAEVAMHAALTGHLVFSTLHTNSAAGTIPRLLDLGVKPAIIAPAINVTMAQRLVRKLCNICKKPAELSASLKKKIKDELKNFPKGVYLPDEKHWIVFGPLSSKCSACSGLGYKGRLGVYEIIIIDDAIERLIIKEPSEFELKREAARQGQITMRQDGFMKILAGLTDFSEIERVLGE